MKHSISKSVPNPLVTRKNPCNSHKTLRIMAQKYTWRLAVLPDNAVITLQKHTGTKYEEWFNSTGAAMYCLCQTGDSSKDWHSILKENRRCQSDPYICAIGCDPQPRTGNAYRYGDLRYYEQGRKVFYTKSDIDKWLLGFISPMIH